MKFCIKKMTSLLLLILAACPAAAVFAESEWAQSRSGAYLPEIPIAEAIQKAPESDAAAAVKTPALADQESPLSPADTSGIDVSEKLYRQIKDYLAVNPGFLSEKTLSDFEAYRTEQGYAELSSDERKAWRLIIFAEAKKSGQDGDSDLAFFRTVDLSSGQLQLLADFLAHRGVTEISDYFKEQYEEAKNMAQREHLLGELKEFEAKGNEFLSQTLSAEAIAGSESAEESKVQEAVISASKITAAPQNPHPMLKLFFYSAGDNGLDMRTLQSQVREKVRRWIKLKRDSARSFNQELGGHPTMQFINKIIYGEKQPAVSDHYRETQIPKQRHALPL